MATEDIPIISLASAEPAAVDRALREVGFLIITDHGVDEDVIDRCWRATAAWFAQTPERKADAPLMDADYPYGYSPLHSELHAGSEEDARARGPDSAEPSVADEKEMWCIGPDNPEADAPARRWPKGATPVVVEMRAAQETYFRAMEDLSDRLLVLLARALNLEDTWFQQYNRKHASALRAINYPAVGEDGLHKGQLRASAHTDYGALTILRPGGPGLQVFTRQDRWVDCPGVSGVSHFVINLGDLMSRWTNNRWLSTPHRVVAPDGGSAAARQAIAYFHNMDMDALISCVPTCLTPDETPKYPPIRAGEHLMKKHDAATRGNKLNIYE
mmetsp:Transcript_2569/g.7697  ORF Transcript_2569/g.7697 Transcript_2569/m.7697 type:complete len:329 (+) Transcript_2569:97-1083(+)